MRRSKPAGTLPRLNRILQPPKSRMSSADRARAGGRSCGGAGTTEERKRNFRGIVACWLLPVTKTRVRAARSLIEGLSGVELRFVFTREGVHPPDSARRSNCRVDSQEAKTENCELRTDP